MCECADQSWVRESVKYITHNSCAISVMSSFNNYINCNNNYYTDLLNYNFQFLLTVLNALINADD